jgi:hypothetical protein
VCSLKPQRTWHSIVSWSMLSRAVSHTYPRGNCLNSVFFLLPAVHTNPSSLHLLHGDSPSHC